MLGLHSVAPGVSYLRLSIVNVVFIQGRTEPDWVLVDAGLRLSARRILRASRTLFGTQRPKSIVLTHGHFDHVGALAPLQRTWPNVPIVAHELEFPYLTGERSYDEPDPTVGGGLMARMAPIYPRGLERTRENRRPGGVYGCELRIVL